MGNFLSDAWEGVKNFFKGPKIPDVPTRNAGGYDPAILKFAEENMTRGMDDQMMKDIRRLTDHFAGRGLMQSTPAMGKMAEIQKDYFNKRANVLGQVYLDNMQQAQENQYYNQDASYQNAVNKRQRWQGTWETVGKVAGMFA